MGAPRSGLYPPFTQLSEYPDIPAPSAFGPIHLPTLEPPVAIASRRLAAAAATAFFRASAAAFLAAAAACLFEAVVCPAIVLYTLQNFLAWPLWLALSPLAGSPLPARLYSPDLWPAKALRSDMCRLPVPPPRP